MAKMPTPDQLLSAIPASFPKEGWMDTKPDFHPGSYCYPAKVDSLKSLGFENAHNWSPANEDWELPENWEEIIRDSCILKKRVKAIRSHQWIGWQMAAIMKRVPERYSVTRDISFFQWCIPWMI